jgi:hypothetical protein
MSNIVLAQMQKVATAFDMVDVDLDQLKQTLVSTVFKGADDVQLVSLLIVANQYKLNPFTKEIYAFPSRGGIVPIVSIDGWSRIINDNPVCDGIQFEQDDESCTCKIYRKDRTHPTIVTEYLSECKGTSEPWKKFPKRMLRHKALIQCARVAFGFSGIFDEDEANRIDDCQKSEIKTVSQQDNRPELSEKQIEMAIGKIKDGKGNLDALQAHYKLTDEQLNYVRAQTKVIEHE